MMKKRYCPECGGELILTRELPIMSWSINDEDFEREDNNIFDDPLLVFYCQNDREHDIGSDSESFQLWEADVLREWEKKIEPFIHTWRKNI